MSRTVRNIIEIFAVFFVFLVIVSQRRNTSYWKERYLDTSIWADTLYEENIRLSDSLIYYRNLKNISPTK